MSPKMGMLEKRIRVTAALVPMYLTTLYGCMFLLFPILPVVLIKRSWFHGIIDYFMGYWFGLTVYLLERVAKIKIYLHQNKRNKEFKESSIVLMNHRTRLDWLFYFCVLYRENSIGFIKIILKAGLELIPGAGWAMQAALFIFIKRKWEEDRGILSSFIAYFKKINKKVNILIYPEGTNLNSWTLGNSDKYAIANNLPCYKKVLHPRTTGFCHVFNEMNNNKILDSVQDVTVAYKGPVPDNELRFLKGKIPDEIHFYIDKIAISDIVDGNKSQEENKSNLESWLKKRWKMKEDFLTCFYDDGIDSEKFQAMQADYAIDSPNGDSTKFLIFYPIFWIASFFLGGYLLYFYLWVRLFLLVSLAFFFYVQFFTSGLETLIMNSRAMCDEEIVDPVSAKV